MSSEDFATWWSNLGCNYLLFNRASKGNLGLVGVGGVIFYYEGNKYKEYAWGLGKKYNNGVEWLALMKGLEIERNCGIKELAIFGDSLMITCKARNLIKNYKSSSIKLHYTFKLLVSEFKDLKVFHILRENNNQVDLMANKGVLLVVEY